MASTLEDLLQALRSDAPGSVGNDLSPELLKAMDAYNSSYTSTFRSLQGAYERGMSGLEKRLGEMAAAYEHTAAVNSDDTRALIRELLTSQKKANEQQTDLNAQWRELAESYFPQISKEQLSNEIAKRREQERRMDLLKQELGISASRVNAVKTEMTLLDSFKSFGKDPIVGSLVEAVKGKIQGGFDERTKAFDDLSKQRDANIVAFQNSARDMYAGIAKGRSPDDTPAQRGAARVAPAQSPVEGAVKNIEGPVEDIATSLKDFTASKAFDETASYLHGIEQHLGGIANLVYGAAAELGIGGGSSVANETPAETTTENPVAEKAAEAASDVATGALGGKGGFVNIAGLGKSLSGVISKGLSSLGNVLFKALGPLGWLASIGQSIDGVLPIFSSTFGALHDVLRMAGPFLTALALEGVTTLLTGINGIAFALDEVVSALPMMGDSMREQAEKSGAMATARAKAQADAEKVEKAQEQSRGGFVPFAPLAPAGGVTVSRQGAPVLARNETVSRQGAPVLARNETALTTPSEERAIMAPAPAAPAPATPDQSPIVSALQRITAPQNPGTTAIFPINPYLQPFAV